MGYGMRWDGEGWDGDGCRGGYNGTGLQTQNTKAITGEGATRLERKRIMQRCDGPDAGAGLGCCCCRPPVLPTARCAC
jgi:hypothetical protein